MQIGDRVRYKGESGIITGTVAGLCQFKRRAASEEMEDGVLVELPKGSYLRNFEPLTYISIILVAKDNCNVEN